MVIIERVLVLQCSSKLLKLKSISIAVWICTQILSVSELSGVFGNYACINIHIYNYNKHILHYMSIYILHVYRYVYIHI